MATVTGRLSKTQRQHRIAELLAGQTIGSQSELVERLAAAGVVATQATVSRDLDEIGAIKVRGPEGGSVYAVPDLPFTQRGGDDHLRRILTDWVVDVAPSANLVVLRTPPGSAHVVGSALDRAGLPGVLGNVAGDDTLIVVTSGADSGEGLAATLRDLAGLDQVHVSPDSTRSM